MCIPHQGKVSGYWVKYRIVFESSILFMILCNVVVVPWQVLLVFLCHKPVSHPFSTSGKVDQAFSPSALSISTENDQCMCVCGSWVMLACNFGLTWFRLDSAILMAPLESCQGYSLAVVLHISQGELSYVMVCWEHVKCPKFSVWCLALWNVRRGRPSQERETTNEMLVVDERKIGQVESELVGYQMVTASLQGAQ